MQSIRINDRIRCRPLIYVVLLGVRLQMHFWKVRIAKVPEVYELQTEARKMRSDSLSRQHQVVSIVFDNLITVTGQDYIIVATGVPTELENGWVSEPLT